MNWFKYICMIMEACRFWTFYLSVYNFNMLFRLQTKTLGKDYNVDNFE